jgi:hypothetical protein
MNAVDGLITDEVSQRDTRIKRESERCKRIETETETETERERERVKKDRER